MKTCPSCNQEDPTLSETSPVEHLRCKCFNEDPRTYFSVIGSDGYSRGAFKTKAEARDWASTATPSFTYTLREYPNAAYIAPAFDSTVLKAAVSKYWALGAVRVAHDESLILSDTLRQETADWMHQNHPIWIAQFNMDLVEWILTTYHGAKQEQ